MWVQDTSTKAIEAAIRVCHLCMNSSFTFMINLLKTSKIL